ncbi:aminoglycoside phosphotransferase [Streptomyces sp. YC504]|uniref:Aminoglycoside phosphotransferase n=1 Tax=Streptomyces mesophilus TaxID=1775132 RepID=A0A6G4XJN2_9ACTN|nr:aminoglycoside phosphotransferase [Streptomyces mesophilus]NGO77755.1 aminoglycoside phosphotransferase [Streptomyces mesophilus]
MPTERFTFDTLPPAAVDAITTHTGPIETVTETSSGFNSEISARITTETGDLFVKGMRTDHPRAWTQQREADTNPYVHGITPALRWRVQTDGWDVLAFDAIDGPHADYADTSDLVLVADMLTRLSHIPAPADLELKDAAHRLRDHAPAEALDLFAGDHLLHTDLNHTNVLVDGERALLVDWAWATRGAPWLDAGYWVLWLISDGSHSAESAESWAARIPAFRTAPRAGVDAFAEANESIWAEIAAADPDPWTQQVHTAAKTWATHRTRKP